jgi:hypothetical protein
MIRLPSSFKKPINTKKDDCISSYQQRSKKETLTIHAIHFELPDGTIEYLVTNLMTNTVTVHNFKELYFCVGELNHNIKNLKAVFALRIFLD